MLEINKENKDASNQILLCKQKIKESNTKEKALYSKMLSDKVLSLTPSDVAVQMGDKHQRIKPKLSDEELNSTINCN